MEKLIVHGGTTLKGTIPISGSKNASLPILAASLLTDQPVTIRRVPDVSDTNYMLQILRALGCEVERYSGTVKIHAKDIRPEAPYDLVRKMRASICVMGPLLGRLGRASVSIPGGCVIGDRPIDLHLKGLEALGATINTEGGNMDIIAKTPLQGREVDLRGKHGTTVLGTDNLIMAAVLTEGTTIIESAACEPEVVDLADFLISMGAKIKGAGTRRIEIEGVSSLSGTDHTVIPDRIEAGTFMVAGALAGDGVTLQRVNRQHLATTTEKLEEAGHHVHFESDTIVTVTPGENPQGCKIATAPYPGFPTDMQAQFSTLFALTPGLSVVEDTIFPQRFMHCAEMTRMGADIKVDNGTAIISGVKELSGAPVMASDLRASAALVLAALRAKGTTEINRLYHIDRGYEHIDDKLALLGAHVERIWHIIAVGKKDEGGKADCAIVLGAAAWNNKPSPVLRERLNHAIDLYHQGRIANLILTGGYGKGAPFSESQVARDYCLEKGIPASALHIEKTSSTTIENIEEAQKIISANKWKNALLVSDPWHLKRALSMSQDHQIKAQPSATKTSVFKSFKARSNFIFKEFLLYHQYLIRGK
nr:UDP-N-acetylglucosamine 1-carboxyvinyltransferase-like [Nerophis lumbriciformis]